MRFRRSLAALVAAFMLATAVPAGVPPAALGVVGPCIDGGYNNPGWAWFETGSPSYSRTAVQAYFDPYIDTFRGCTSGGAETGSVSAWVAVVPRSAAIATANTILQVGIIKTAAYSAPFYIYAKGGCGSQPIPLATVMPGSNGNSGDWARHAYVMWRYWGSPGWYWRLQVNSYPNNTPLYWIDISESDPAISCWITGNNKAMWSGERGDRGDSLGTNPSIGGHPGIFDTMAFKATNSSSWQFVGTGPCYVLETVGFGDDGCSRPSANKMYVWSNG